MYLHGSLENKHFLVSESMLFSTKFIEPSVEALSEEFFSGSFVFVEDVDQEVDRGLCRVFLQS
jgi:hypothetical protein